MTQPEEEKKRLNKKRNIKPAGQHEKVCHMYNCSFRRKNKKEETEVEEEEEWVKKRKEEKKRKMKRNQPFNEIYLALE